MSLKVCAQNNNVGRLQIQIKVYASIMFHQQYCPSAPFLMKIDDDVGFHVDRMLSLWNADENASSSLYGQLIESALPVRNPRSKW
ncbi:hypothetical protein KIN20_008528 [Parelaphostrongylus tenuis]|uniref:Hexosyltransferase n=1 Tax=Parelaphostrongylus tenuis TaxID=148309 RepID=A0AAD5QJV2_PARTN|nr:hypothetical protein KIN20_008528 [Parelaphostrongylus tenuis]